MGLSDVYAATAASSSVSASTMNTIVGTGSLPDFDTMSVESSGPGSMGRGFGGGGEGGGGGGFSGNNSSSSKVFVPVPLGLGSSRRSLAGPQGGSGRQVSKKASKQKLLRGREKEREKGGGGRGREGEIGRGRRTIGTLDELVLLRRVLSPPTHPPPPTE